MIFPDKMPQLEPTPFAREVYRPSVHPCKAFLGFGLFLVWGRNFYAFHKPKLTIFLCIRVTREIEEEKVPLNADDTVHVQGSSKTYIRWVPPLMDNPVKIQCNGEDLSREMEERVPSSVNIPVHIQRISRPDIWWVPPVMDNPDVKIQCTRENPSRETEGETEINALLNRTSSWSTTGCISGVPTKLYKQNKAAYTPQAVVIGPIHHGKAVLRPMQLNKEHYFKCFFKRTPTDKNLYYQKAKEWEGKARGCYQDQIDLKPNEFVNMLLLDGIFMIEFFLRLCSPEMRDKDDDIFKKELLKDDIFHDLVVLENQLPFFVLEGLYNLSYNSVTWVEFLYGIASQYWRRKVDIERVKETLERSDVRHLADFLHGICVASIPRWPSETRQKFELSRSATELRKAGVKFIMVRTNLPFDLVFNDNDGSLEFPFLLVNRWTEIFFRNFIAHEHCLHKDKIISSYIILLGNLLRNSKDVDLFIEYGILDNQSLGDSEDVCTLFKNLYSKSMMDQSEFYYTSLCKRLNEYSKDSWHQWKAACYMWEEMLKRDYFSNPWSIVSVIAASVLLVLTIIQTATSVIAVRWF